MDAHKSQSTIFMFDFTCIYTRKVEENIGSGGTGVMCNDYPCTTVQPCHNFVVLCRLQSSDPCNISTCYKSGTTKPPTTVTPTRLPVQSSSTPISHPQTTYAKDHAHGSTTVKSGANVTATTDSKATVNGTTERPGVVKSTAGVAGNATTPKSTVNEIHDKLLFIYYVRAERSLTL